MKKRIGVLVADGDSLLAEDILVSLQNEKRIDVIEVAESELPLPELIEIHHPDILLLDIDHGRALDYSMISNIRTVFDDRTRVIGLSQSSEISNVAAFFQAGGWGYELKTCPENEIGIAVRQVFRGKGFVCSSLSGDCIRAGVAAYPPLEPALLETLTFMQRRVLIIYKECGSIKEIAVITDRSVNTAEKHIERIMGKLGISSQRELSGRLMFTKLE